MQVVDAVSTYLDIADSTAPGLIEGLYIVGSYALDDWIVDRSDIDIIAVTAEPGTDEDFGALRTMYALLAEASVGHIDGPYIAWSDLTIAPTTGLHRPWALDGEPHHDGDCFEINPVTWYTLQRYGVTVRGPLPDQLGIWVDTDERIRFVVSNLENYWSTVADDVAQACTATDRSFDTASFEWCMLGALRCTTPPSPATSPPSAAQPTTGSPSLPPSSTRRCISPPTCAQVAPLPTPSPRGRWRSPPTSSAGSSPTSRLPDSRADAGRSCPTYGAGGWSPRSPSRSSHLDTVSGAGAVASANASGTVVARCAIERCTGRTNPLATAMSIQSNIADQ